MLKLGLVTWGGILERAFPSASEDWVKEYTNVAKESASDCAEMTSREGLEACLLLTLEDIVHEGINNLPESSIDRYFKSIDEEAEWIRNMFDRHRL